MTTNPRSSRAPTVDVIKHQLQFSQCPPDSAFDTRSILIGLPKHLSARMALLPLTLERAESAAMFAGQSAKQSEPWRAAAFLRAALADYCAMEEIQTMDRPTTKALKISATANPLLHILELLRHLSIHVKTMHARQHTVAATIDVHTVDLQVFVITNLEASDLAALRNGKHYDLADLQKTVTWFNSRQNHWGAGDLISIGTQLLAQQICQHHGI